MSTKEPRPRRSTRSMIVHRTQPVIYKACRTAADVRDTLEFFTATGTDAVAVPADWTWTGTRWTPPEK
jgi:hypothetical protein